MLHCVFLADRGLTSYRIVHFVSPRGRRIARLTQRADLGLRPCHWPENCGPGIYELDVDANSASATCIAIWRRKPSDVATTRHRRSGAGADARAPFNNKT